MSHPGRTNRKRGGRQPAASPSRPIVLAYDGRTWVFGTLLLLFFVSVFTIGPDKLPEFKQRMLGISCGLLAVSSLTFNSTPLSLCGRLACKDARDSRKPLFCRVSLSLHGCNREHLAF